MTHAIKSDIFLSGDDVAITSHLLYGFQYDSTVSIALSVFLVRGPFKRDKML